jgi:hypothetical protein
MSTAELVLVSVTSALVAVFAMLLVATIKRARDRDRALKAEEKKVSSESP